MLYLLIAVFSAAGIFGAIILISLLQKKNTPKTIVFIHGIIAVAGIMMLLGYAIYNPERFPETATIFFVLAAVGGLYLFVRDMTNKSKPILIALLHGLLAVTGLVVLIWFTFFVK